MSDTAEKCVFDHLVIGAQDLTMGRQWFTQVFESEIATGGKHPDMSTHNLLSSMSDTAFLEIIAIDQAAPAPERTRWFSLDSPATQKRLSPVPKLLTWVVGTPNLDKSISALQSLGIHVGNAVELRRGDLQWRLSVPEDGALIEHGVIPSLIEWQSGTHPAGAMQSNGLHLQELTLRHPDPHKIKQALQIIGAENLATVTSSGSDEPSLIANIDSPVGRRLVS
jgi:hypothetical protein